MHIPATWRGFFFNIWWGWFGSTSRRLKISLTKSTLPALLIEKENHPQHFHKFIEQFLNYCMKILSKCNVEEKIYCTYLTQRYRSVEPPSCSAYSWLILRSSSYSLSINSWRLPSCRATSISSCGALMQLFILWKRKENHTQHIHKFSWAIFFL